MTDQAITQRSFIEYIPLDELIGWERNPKDHDLPSIQKSIKRFGFTSPVLIDERTHRIVAGHGRVDSLRGLQSNGEAPPLRVIDDKGKWLVPVLRGISFNSDSEVEAYLVADNQLTIAGGWDDIKLATILKDLEKLGDGAFDGLGFQQAEIDAILTNLANQSGRDTQREVARRTLAEMFVVPPFSVLDARQGYWQDRKRAWIALGIRSEIGRGQNLLKFSKTAQIGVGGRKPLGKNGKGLAEAYSSGAPGSLGKLYNKAGGRLADYQADNPEETGTSIFDPVLCEILYKWFAPQAGKVLDPFSGGSVRGIVAGHLGYAYTGIDLSAEQVKANQAQAAEIKLDIKAYQNQAPAEQLAPTMLPPNLALAEREGRPRLLPDILSSGQGATDALELYAATSSVPFQRDWSATAELIPYLELVYNAANQPYNITSTGKTEPYKPLIDNGTCWVQFTGGKDSTAAALIAQAKGYKVICYHLAGLNRGMGYEANNCKLICERMGWTLIIDKVHAVGKKNGLIELPTKNQVSCLAMLSRMAEVGGAVWTSGFSPDDTPTSWDYDFSDGKEAIGLFNDYLTALYPNQQMIYAIEDEIESWATIADAGLINYIRGCVCPVRFLEQRRAANERKFGKLLPNRCGSCPKCAWEALALEKLGIIPPLSSEHRKHYEKFMEELISPEHPTLQTTINSLVNPATIDRFRKPVWIAQAPYEPTQTFVANSVAEQESDGEQNALMTGWRKITKATIPLLLQYYQAYHKTRKYPRFFMSPLYLIAYGYYYKEANGCLLILEKTFLWKSPVLYFPVPPISLAGDINQEKAIIEAYKAINVNARLSTEDCALYGYNPDDMVDDRIGGEYIYKASSVQNLSGGAYHDERNTLNRYQKAIEAGTVSEIRTTNPNQAELDKCSKTLAAWGLHKDIPIKKEKTLLTALPKTEGATLWILSSGGACLGYTITESIGDDWGIITDRKHDYIGYEQAGLNNFGTLAHITDLRYAADNLNPEALLNMGGAGIKGLEQSKKQLEPEEILMIYKFKLGNPERSTYDSFQAVDDKPQAAPVINGFVEPTWIVGDSVKLDTLIPQDEQFDFVMSCPPYHDLEQYSEDPADLSNMIWCDFSKAYKAIIRQAISHLKEDRFACFVVGEIRNQDGGGFYKGFINLTFEAFEEAGALFYNDMILVTAIGSLPIRVGKQFTGNRKIGKTHQNILVFYKGNPSKIKDLFPTTVPNADLSIFTDQPEPEGD